MGFRFCVHVYLCVRIMLDLIFTYSDKNVEEGTPRHIHSVFSPGRP